jgi:hypothetical protein
LCHQAWLDNDFCQCHTKTKPYLRFERRLYLWRLRPPNPIKHHR